MVYKYYQKHQETLWKKAHARYQNFSEEEKVKRRKNAWERYWNFTKKKEKQRHQCYLEQEKKLPVYRRNYYSVQEKQLLGPS